jgi:hypothetical protein
MPGPATTPPGSLALQESEARKFSPLWYLLEDYTRFCRYLERTGCYYRANGPKSIINSLGFPDSNGNLDSTPYPPLQPKVSN